jgi:hypothetical protein
MQTRVTPIACAPGVVREGFGEDLDRDVSVQLGVARPVHLPHPAFANLRGDFVDAETRAGSESQVADYTGGTGARRRLVLINGQGFSERAYLRYLFAFEAGTTNR